MRTLIIIFILFFSSCKTHVFENVVECDYCFDNIAELKNLDLSKFKAYYSSSHRNEDELETVIKGDPPLGSGVHLTDVQYLLINNQTNEFIHIAYIPTRYKTGRSKYYMDTYLKDYRTKINIYYINQFHYGKIENGKLVYLYKDANFKRSGKNLQIAFTQEESKITLTKIETEKETAPQDLNSIVNEDQLEFIKMNEVELIIYGTDDNKSYKVQNHVILTKFDRHKRTGNLLCGIGNGKRS